MAVIKVPDIGEGIAEVEIAEWHVAPGDTVDEDQLLVDVMTDKATVQVPSTIAGQVVELGGAVGDTLAVGAMLIRIEAATGDPAATKPAAVTAPASAPASLPTSPPAAPAPAAPSAPAAAPAAGTAPASRPPSPAASARPAESLPAPLRAGRRVLASPALRARAWELGVDLAEVAATGTAGRVTQADLDAHLARHPPRRPPVAAARAAASSPAAPDTVTETKVTGLRRRIAQKMMDAKRRIPHFAYVEEVDVSEVEAARAVLNDDAARAGRTHLTLLPFIVRAVVLAVHEYPQVNAHFDDEAGVVSSHTAVHAGIATQTAAGLVVPVLRDAGAHDLWTTAAEIARLAEAARSGRAVRGELSGSTITITSLGALGGIASTPIINAPEVAIVGVNRIVEKPVVRGGAVVVRKTMNLSSSFDHRIVDGAVAAAFIQAVRRRLEHPTLLFTP